MSAPSLPGLANDLVLHVLQLLPNCRAVAALNRTSQKFYQIWRANAAIISDAVLPRAVFCAEELESVQFQIAQERERKAKKPETDEQETEEAGDPYQKILKRINRFAANAAMILKECTDLLTKGLRNFFQRGEGQAANEFRCNLHRVRYRIHCIAALSSNRAAQDEYLGATSVGGLTTMEDDRLWTDPRHYYNDSVYRSMYIKT